MSNAEETTDANQPKTPPELVELYGLFPRADRSGRELNRMWVNLLRNHPSDVVRAVLHSHRLSRKGNDPCISTVSEMLARARAQHDSPYRRDGGIQDSEYIQPYRAWAIANHGQDAKNWSAVKIMEHRIVYEWNGTPHNLRPEWGTEWNTEPFRGMLHAVGVGEAEADRKILELTGLNPIRKYDGMTMQQMSAAHKRTMDAIDRKVNAKPTPSPTTAQQAVRSLVSRQIVERESCDPPVFIEDKGAQQ